MSAFRTGKLYCYILRKSQSSLHVDITDCTTVSELKEKILLKNQLKIWKVCWNKNREFSEFQCAMKGQKMSG